MLSISLHSVCHHSIVMSDRCCRSLSQTRHKEDRRLMQGNITHAWRCGPFTSPNIGQKDEQPQIAVTIESEVKAFISLFYRNCPKEVVRGLSREVLYTTKSPNQVAPLEGCVTTL